MVIFNLKNFAPHDFREKQEVRHSVDPNTDLRRQKHLDIINALEAEAQRRRERGETDP